MGADSGVPVRIGSCDHIEVITTDPVDGLTSTAMFQAMNRRAGARGGSRTWFGRRLLNSAAIVGPHAQWCRDWGRVVTPRACRQGRQPGHSARCLLDVKGGRDRLTNSLGKRLATARVLVNAITRAVIAI